MSNRTNEMRKQVNVKWLGFLTVATLALSSCLDGEDPNKQLNQEIQQIYDYLVNTGQADNALQNNDGIFLVFNQHGEFPPAKPNQIVTVHYSGRVFPDGAVFDSGTKTQRFEDLTPLGITRSLSGILTGSVVKAYVPSKYGYGDVGTTDVPPNSILVYDLWLEETQLTALEQSRAVSDSTAIKNYLDANQISATYHPSGAWYEITEIGTGDIPNPYGTSTFEYDLSTLEEPETSIENGTIAQPISTLIDGFRILLPKLAAGTKANLYLPSRLAYGENSPGAGIPANSNLIFEINITAVE